MAEQLYALQRDVDKLSKDMQELRCSYTIVDFIAHNVKNLWDEHVCQAEQMKRMEEDIREIKSDVSQIKSDVQQLKLDVQFLKDQLVLVFQQLKLITDHLKLTPKKTKQKLA